MYLTNIQLIMYCMIYRLTLSKFNNMRLSLYSIRLYGSRLVGRHFAVSFFSNTFGLSIVSDRLTFQFNCQFRQFSATNLLGLCRPLVDSLKACPSYSMSAVFLCVTNICISIKLSTLWFLRCHHERKLSHPPFLSNNQLNQQLHTSSPVSPQPSTPFACLFFYLYPTVTLSLSR